MILLPTTRRCSSNLLLDFNRRLLVTIKPSTHAPSSSTRAMSTTNNKSSAFTSLQGPEHHATLEVKKSRFLTWAWPVSSPEEALQLIDTKKDPSASHNCFAFKIGQNYRSSDDGEPSGTAGRPILAAIEAEGLDHVAVLVVRYYGGIKLGTGGLARAYGGAARELLKEAPRQQISPSASLSINVPYELLGVVYQVLQSNNAQKMNESYDGPDGGVVLEVLVQQDAVESLQDALLDASSGKVVTTSNS